MKHPPRPRKQKVEVSRKERHVVLHICECSHYKHEHELKLFGMGRCETCMCCKWKDSGETKEWDTWDIKYKDVPEPPCEVD